MLRVLGLDRSQVQVFKSLSVQRPNVRSTDTRKRNPHRLGEVDMLVARKCELDHEHSTECYLVSRAAAVQVSLAEPDTWWL